MKFFYLFKIYRQIKSRVFSVFSKVLLKLWDVKVGHGLIVTFPPVILKEKSATIELGNNISLLVSVLHNCLCSGSKLVLAAIRPGACITIGDNAGISCSTIVAMKSVQIGNNVFIGANCTITDSDFHSLDFDQRIQSTDDGEIDAVIIENNVWLSMNVVVLKGVTIGENSVIAANSVVINNIPANCLAGGTPAKVIKPLANLT